MFLRIHPTPSTFFLSSVVCLVSLACFPRLFVWMRHMSPGGFEHCLVSCCWISALGNTSGYRYDARLDRYWVLTKREQASCPRYRTIADIDRTRFNDVLDS